MDVNFKAQKADVARLLSWLLTEPDEEMVEALSNREIHRLFSDYFKSIHGSIPPLEGFLPQDDQPNLLHLMREDYRRLFQDSTTSDLCWVESVHKVWTNDPECRLSMAKEKGYLMGDSALHMIDLYGCLGLEVSEEYVGLPDHIVLELEFLAILLETFSEEEVRIFLKDHLDWVPEMVSRARNYQPSAFYRSVFEALGTFIELERKEMGKEVLVSVE